MKNKLQYAYTIVVFAGVLVTAYLMMNTEGSSQVPLRALQAPSSFRTEALVVDPAINQLFEMENALTKRPLDERREEKRAPSRVEIDER